MLAKSRALDGLKEASRNDDIGVNVGSRERGSNTLKNGEGLHTSGLGLGSRGAGEGAGLARGLHDLANIGETTSDGSGGGHGRADQVGAATGSLASLEVTVAGGGTTFTRLKLVSVHTKAHGAASLTEVKSSVEEDLVKALINSHLLNETRARDNHSVLDVFSNLLALDDVSDGTKILNTSVGTRSDEDLVNLDAIERGVGLEAHVLKSALHGVALVLSLCQFGVRNHTVDGGNHLGVGSPGDLGGNFCGLDHDLLVVGGTLIRREGAPVLNSLVPYLSLGGHRASLEVSEGNLIGCHKSCTGSLLDTHVTEGGASLHGQATDGLTSVLDNVSVASGSTDDTDDVEDNVLGGHTKRKLTVDCDAHALGRALDEGLRGKHVLNLGGTNAEGKRSEGTVGGCMGVTTNHGASGQSESLLESNNVHNTLALVAESEVGKLVVLGVVVKSGHLQEGLGRLTELALAAALTGGHVMVRGTEETLGVANRATGHTKTLEGLGRGDLVDHHTIDTNEAGTIVLGVNDVVIPDLLKKSAGLARGSGAEEDHTLGVGKARHKGVLHLGESPRIAEGGERHFGLFQERKLLRSQG